MEAQQEPEPHDERTRAALARLTDNEKQCLRRRLRHQTAKQMAIDLGISPHAVEKRLKMARAKLGVSSSLDAARLLDAAERYGGSIPRPADLPGTGPTPQDERAAAIPTGDRRARAIGGSSMFVAACLAALTAQDVPRTHPLPVPPGNERQEDVVFRPAAPAEIEAFVRDSFRTMDKDGSGWIERDEAPEGGIYTGPPTDAALTTIHGRVGRAMTVAQADTDGDGRISEAEFVASRTPMFIGRGVPANWRGAKAAAAPVAPADRAVHLSDIATRKVDMNEAAAFNAEDFGHKDRDGSGFLDPAEVSALEPRDADRDKILPPAPPAGQPDVAGARKWMAKLDTNRDGRVSLEEYVAYMTPWTLWQGVPAFWHRPGN